MRTAAELHQGLPGGWRWLAALAALAVLALLVVVLATRHGAGVTPDGIQYIRAAEDLAAGRTMSVMQSFDFAGPVPMTSRPPGLSLALAAAARLGAPPAVAARWLNALLFGANILLVGLLARRLTGSAAAALLSALLALLATDMVRYHSLVLSDPAFLFLALAALYLLDRHLAGESRGALAASAVAAGLALLTRYPGIGLVAACALALARWGRGTRRQRLRDAAIHATIALAPIGLWLVRNQLVADRRLYDRVTPGLPDLALELTTNAAALSRFAWLFPFGGFRGPGTPGQVLLAGLVTAALIALAVARVAARPAAGGRLEPAPRSRLAPLLLLFSACHWLAFYAALVLFFPSSFLEARQMLPAALALTLLAVAFMARWLSGRGSRLAAGIAAGLVAIVLFGHLRESHRWVARARAHGLMRNSLSWQRSPTLAWLRQPGGAGTVFSNQANAIYFHTGVEARYLPCASGQIWPAEEGSRFGPNPDFETQMNELEQSLVEDGAIIVFFGRTGGRRFPGPEDLLAALPIEPVASFPDAVVYAGRN